MTRSAWSALLLTIAGASIAMTTVIARPEKEVVLDLPASPDCETHVARVEALIAEVIHPHVKDSVIAFCLKQPDGGPPPARVTLKASYLGDVTAFAGRLRELNLPPGTKISVSWDIDRWDGCCDKNPN